MSKLSFYLMYLAISLGITIWVGTTLRRSGRKFLLRSLESEDMADTVNQLLQIGFYLANIGYIASVFRSWDPLNTTEAVLEATIPKLGGLMLILGLVHLFNMLILARMRRSGGDARPAGTTPAIHTPAKILEEAYHLRS